MSAGEDPRSHAGGGDSRTDFDDASELIARGDLSGAQEAFQRADDAGDPAAATAIGQLHEARGETAQAQAAYERADERGDGYGAFRLGLLLSSHERWDDANRAWARADERGHDPRLEALQSQLRRADSAEREAIGTGAPRSAFANPVLVGAVTVLVAMVAVFLAYNANQGLPFVPTKQLKVDIADGSNLVVGNDVREGGFRVGLVSSMRPIRLPGGTVAAQLTLQLNQANGRVPVDSTATILPRSVLGLKYVALNVGSSSRVFADGGTMPIEQTSVPVQFDDIFKTFDPPTRVAIQQDLRGFGDTLAARGSALNDTIASLPSLFGYLRPVAAYLSDRRSRLIPFFDALDRFMGAVAPVAATNARLFTDMATTFEAISRDPRALESTIAQSPSTLSVSTQSLVVQQPFLVDLASFGRYMTPASESLKLALPQIDPAIEAGTRTLIRTPSLNSRLQQVMGALQQLAQAPGTNIGINALSATVSTLNPMVRYLGPYQTVCDYWNYWWTFLSEHLSEQTQYGFGQRALLNFADASQPNNVGQQGATAPANGQAGGPEFEHSQNYGAAIDNQGNADCETGQRGYPHKLNYFDPQGRALGTDQHTPGDQGPTFAGRARVPKGETFNRNPTTGPQTLYNPSNP